MEAVPIAEAARRRGISADEVWNRVRGGELADPAGLYGRLDWDGRAAA